MYAIQNGNGQEEDIYYSELNNILKKRGYTSSKGVMEQRQVDPRYDISPKFEIDGVFTSNENENNNPKRILYEYNGPRHYIYAKFDDDSTSPKKDMDKDKPNTSTIIMPNFINYLLYNLAFLAKTKSLKNDEKMIIINFFEADIVPIFLRVKYINTLLYENDIIKDNSDIWKRNLPIVQLPQMYDNVIDWIYNYKIHKKETNYDKKKTMIQNVRTTRDKNDIRFEEINSKNEKKLYELKCSYE